jgi:hypothetical protein
MATFRAGKCAVGLAVLIALAGCGSDDDSKSDAGKTTGTSRPSRGFEKGKAPGAVTRTKRFATHVAFIDPGGLKDKCTYFIFQENHQCTGGTFQDVDNPTSPFATPDDGEGSLVWKEANDRVQLELTAVDPDTGPYARLAGTIPPRRVTDRNAFTVTDGKVPNWRAINLRTGTDPNKVGEQGGPLKFTVTSREPTNDVVYTVDIRGWLSYDVTPSKAAKPDGRNR